METATHAVKEAKKEARRSYERYFNIADSRDYSCGMSMAAMITPELAKEARKFNAAMRTLEELDPNCPKWQALPEGK